MLLLLLLPTFKQKLPRLEGEEISHISVGRDDPSHEQEHLAKVKPGGDRGMCGTVGG